MNSYYNVPKSQEAYNKWLEDKNIKGKIDRERLKMKQQLEKLLNDVKVEKKNCNEEAYKKWLAEKNRIKKEQEDKQQLILKLEKLHKEVKNQLQIQKHKAWLEEKKQCEAKQLREELEQKKLQERMNREQQKRNNSVQRFKEWVQRKEEENLHNALVKKVIIAKEVQAQELRRKASRKAYEEWVKKSKNKPKPVPSNRGLESLSTSVSVRFINPKPWVPNIEIRKH